MQRSTSNFQLPTSKGGALNLLDISVHSLHHSRPMPGFFGEPRQQAVVLLFLGGLGLLISVMLAARAMEFEQDATPRRRILAHWLPIVAAVLLATVLGYGEMGVARLFGTSVAVWAVASGLALPMGRRGVQTASEGRTAMAIGAQVGIVILNFTVLMPGAILLRLILGGRSGPATGPTSGVAIEPFLYPRLSWRIDAVA